ncbi:hypothetical protein CIB48_g9054 [Xylaria polymorpha]|nr:hypothetical protein CIB48_g9054 [Xylaria polymorpha]
MHNLQGSRTTLEVITPSVQPADESLDVNPRAYLHAYTDDFTGDLLTTDRPGHSPLCSQHEARVNVSTEPYARYDQWRSGRLMAVTPPRVYTSRTLLKSIIAIHRNTEEDHMKITVRAITGIVATSSALFTQYYILGNPNFQTQPNAFELGSSRACLLNVIILAYKSHLQDDNYSVAIILHIPSGTLTFSPTGLILPKKQHRQPTARGKHRMTQSLDTGSWDPSRRVSPIDTLTEEIPTRQSSIWSRRMDRFQHKEVAV